MKTAQEILGGILPLSIWDSWDENLCNCPPHYIIEAMQEEDPIFAFNKAIIDATADYCVAYKPNMAFYESMGVKGIMAFEKTVK